MEKKITHFLEQILTNNEWVNIAICLAILLLLSLWLFFNILTYLTVVIISDSKYVQPYVEKYPIFKKIILYYKATSFPFLIFEIGMVLNIYFIIIYNCYRVVSAYKNANPS